jgi:hypothetical protein
MKNTLLTITAALLSASAGFGQISSNYTDATGDTALSAPNQDIASFEVSNNATDVVMTLSMFVNNPGWGNYLVGIKTPSAPASTTNPWGRPITFTNTPINYWIGTWTDGGGGSQLWSYNGTSWSNTGALSSFVFSSSTNKAVMTFSLASAGLAVGDIFTFDVFSSGSGGGDAAIDSLNDPNVTTSSWTGTYNSTLSSSYQVVPEPSTVALLALSALGVAGYAARRRARK